MQEIVWQIHNEGAISEKHPLQRVPFLEWARTPLSPLKSSALLIKNLPTPRLLKSHLPYGVVPKSVDEVKKCKIYLPCSQSKGCRIMSSPMCQLLDLKGHLNFLASCLLQAMVSVSMAISVIFMPLNVVVPLGVSVLLYFCQHLCKKFLFQFLMITHFVLHSPTHPRTCSNPPASLPTHPLLFDLNPYIRQIF